MPAEREARSRTRDSPSPTLSGHDDRFPELPENPRVARASRSKSRGDHSRSGSRRRRQGLQDLDLVESDNEHPIVSHSNRNGGQQDSNTFTSNVHVPSFTLNNEPIEPHLNYSKWDNEEKRDKTYNPDKTASLQEKYRTQGGFLGTVDRVKHLESIGHRVFRRGARSNVKAERRLGGEYKDCYKVSVEASRKMMGH